MSHLSPSSPVLSRVGSDASDGFPKARHILPMGSQAKAADPEEFLAWCARINLEQYIVEHKLDGASLELQYENGRLDPGPSPGATVYWEMTSHAMPA
ncbi:hypothetical protein MASR2M48_27180 [Spirochaetota bacterium]